MALSAYSARQHMPRLLLLARQPCALPALLRLQLMSALVLFINSVTVAVFLYAYVLESMWSVPCFARTRACLALPNRAPAPWPDSRRTPTPGPTGASRA